MFLPVVSPLSMSHIHPFHSLKTNVLWHLYHVIAAVFYTSHVLYALSWTSSICVFLIFDSFWTCKQRFIHLFFFPAAQRQIKIVGFGHVIACTLPEYAALIKYNYTWHVVYSVRTSTSPHITVSTSSMSTGESPGRVKSVTSWFPTVCMYHARPNVHPI